MATLAYAAVAFAFGILVGMVGAAVSSGPSWRNERAEREKRRKAALAKWREMEALSLQYRSIRLEAGEYLVTGGREKAEVARSFFDAVRALQVRRDREELSMIFDCNGHLVCCEAMGEDSVHLVSAPDVLPSDWLKAMKQTRSG